MLLWFWCVFYLKFFAFGLERTGKKQSNSILITTGARQSSWAIPANREGTFDVRKHYVNNLGMPYAWTSVCHTVQTQSNRNLRPRYIWRSGAWTPHPPSCTRDTDRIGRFGWLGEGEGSNDDVLYGLEKYSSEETCSNFRTRPVYGPRINEHKSTFPEKRR